MAASLCMDGGSGRKHLDMGVNGLISDKPYLVKEVLEDDPAQGIPSTEDYYFS